MSNFRVKVALSMKKSFTKPCDGMNLVKGTKVTPELRVEEMRPELLSIGQGCGG